MTEVLTARVKMSRRELIMVVLLVASVVINYVDRGNLAMAMPFIEHQFTLSPLQIASLLGAFFWTYALLQALGLAGWVVDRFHPGWVLFVGYLLWAITTGLTGLTSSFAALFLLRLFLGAGESVAYPCYSRIFASMSQQHRGRANSFIDAGTKMGPAVGVFFGGIILVHVGWRLLFGLFGLGGLLWLLLWWKAMPPAPPVSSSATAAGFLESRHSIIKILRLRCAWGTFIGHFCGNYFYYFLMAWLPRYLVKEEHLSVLFMSRLTAALFFLIGGTTLTAGWISDRLIAHGRSVTGVRLTVATGGMVVASCLMLSSVLSGHPIASLAILVVGSVGYGAYSSNHWAIAQTLAGPDMAGRWSSLQNGVANLSGIVAPWVAGLALQTSGSSRAAFTVAGVVALVGAFAWGVLVQRVEPVVWEKA